ncbi:hypothetical protein, partial [Perlabentimonas gracilis]|uniref:hypothetical protein n=1 Tax=Perlabentimonas gracilis TaxID=2715279 RepID=UPI001C627756
QGYACLARKTTLAGGKNLNSHLLRRCSNSRFFFTARCTCFSAHQPMPEGKRIDLGKTNHILISSFSADHRLSIPLFHIAYIAIGLGVQQGGQQHPCLPKRQCRQGFTFPPDRFSRAGILCLLSHQGESKGAFT